jgi:hypothetical protein
MRQSPKRVNFMFFQVNVKAFHVGNKDLFFIRIECDLMNEKRFGKKKHNIVTGW